MTNERETIKDISVEVRKTNGGIADRLDAAYDRMKVASNAVVYNGKVYYEQKRCGKLPHGMAVQDALSDLVKALEFVNEKQQRIECINISLALAYQRAKEALKYPPRNCDVGGEEEQGARFRDFCLSQDNYNCRHGCLQSPHAFDCFCKWAQMPYEKGADK